jgi:hypothetical protein
MTEQGGADDGLNASSPLLLLLLPMASLMMFTLATTETRSQAPSLTIARRTAAHCAETLTPHVTRHMSSRHYLVH